MRREFKVTVVVDGNKVIFEFPDDVTAAFNGITESAGKRAVTAETSTAANVSEKEFVSQKRPRSHAEIVATLAFYLRESGLSEFTAADIRRAYIRAGVRPPKVVAQALRDAKNRYDLVESGSKRSTFRLSPHGERTVLFDLPPADDGK